MFGSSLAIAEPRVFRPANDPGTAVAMGGCAVAALPLDATCAAIARRLFRQAAEGVGLPPDVAHDGATMASELAANTLHAHANIQFHGSPVRPAAGMPELWLYLRRMGGQQELVCKLFDSLPGWKLGVAPDPAGGPADPAGGPADSENGPADSENGRGLRVVEGLSEGRWGHHPTRARLGGWKVPGKAVWFAVPVPVARALDRFHGPQPGSCEAASELQLMLDERGIGDQIVRADAPASGMSVLSIRRDLTVWCRSRVVSWTMRDGHRECRAFYDMVEAAEQIVCRHEELDIGRKAAGA
jgi:hypothetical protein